MLKTSSLYRSILFYLFLIPFDLLSLTLLLRLSFFLRWDLLPNFSPNFPPMAHPFNRYLWFILTHFLVTIYEGIYTRRMTFWDELRLLWKSSLASGIIIFSLFFLGKQADFYSRTVCLSWLALCLLLFPFLHLNFKQLLYRIGLGQEKLLIHGLTKNALKFLEAVKANRNLGYEVVGFIDDEINRPEVMGLRVFKYSDELERYLLRSDVRTIVLTEKTDPSQAVNRLLSKVKRLRTVFYLPEVEKIPILGSQVRSFLSQDLFILELKNNLANPISYLTKRISDYLLTLFLLPLILPLMGGIALLVKLTSPGPVIFTQVREGRGGRPFNCYKFRTMYVDSAGRLQNHLEANPQAKAEWECRFKLSEDPRVTPIGRFLRKSSLDELPQLFNVLKGEMSLIGPRPVTKEELTKYYKENAKLYHLVPPGLTGLWQVSGRSHTTYEERVSLDCWYIRNWSLWLDVIILLKTIKVVLKGEGAY